MITVNQTTISEAQILQEMQYHPAKDHRAAMIDAAESLIIGELFNQRLDALGLHLQTDEQQESEEQKQNALLNLLIEAEVAIPCATEQECAHYYQQNLAKFCSSPLIAARHILIPAPAEDEHARANALETAESILEALNKGESFSVLAGQHSRCESARLGGQLGQLSKGQTVSEFERQVFSADEGLINHPVESRFGFHIVFVDFKQAGKQLPYEAVKLRIKDYLNKKVERKAIAQYIECLIAEAKIDGFDFNVSTSPLVQ
ncbi:peptidylprolyl isomerase [Pseudoalteromonas sp. OOF1S-7]|uniref:peptidylprolyl isomerase n=1 Tax=Pseudoalteromonas sp. OOF1S-7 TaxID=2917757 RepID=UPI001EF4ED4C|nr:peptidylprolyl isomerase [Pseudoalteromonas sp. OOF1S-7]MCG7533481.1 peptidylprolyl isomerase [Pseudoalteromonas sp. OOF1S-7]